MADYDIEVTVNPKVVASAVETEETGDRARAAAEAVLAHEGQPTGASLSVVITDDDEVAALNATFRQVDGPTDVLSFPMSAGEDDTFVSPDTEDTYLGDVVISLPRAREQALAAGHSVWSELALLVVHGCLHLLGHDHAAPDEKRVMWARQDAILQALGEPPTPIG